jgi:peptidoglycan/LPS O-acetylase OafA/YrhL
VSFFRITSQKNAIAFLDGLRAIACFTVVFYHINIVTQDPRIHIWAPAMLGRFAVAVALAGWCGVTLFFVLSGFLLFMPYARALLFDGEWPDWKRYYVRRIFRNWPGYFVSLLIMLLWLHPEYLHLDHWRDLVLFGTFFMDSTAQTFQAINGPFWTLAVEWQFYLVLPVIALLFAWIMRRSPAHWRVWGITLCLGGVMIWGVLTRIWGRSWILDPDQAFLLPPAIHRFVFFFCYGQAGKFLEDFAVGMLISVWYVLAQEKGDEYRIVRILRSWSDWLWGIGLLWLVFMGTWSIIPAIQPSLGSWMGERGVLTELSFAIGYGACLIAMLFGPAYQRKPLEWGPLRYLGHLSYSIYMWHLPILLWFIGGIQGLIPRWPAIISYGLCWGSIFFLVVPFCYLFYICIERPGIELGALCLRRRKYLPIVAAR